MVSAALKLGIALFLFPLLISGAPHNVLSDSQYLITNWHSEDGLPHDSGNCITQTRDGYLWVGTHVGLARFDGARFTRFSPTNTPELAANRVTEIFEDQSGILWVGLDTGRLVAWQNGKARIHLVGTGRSQTIVKMVQDVSGIIFFQTSEGSLRRLTASGDEAVALNGLRPNARVSSLATDDQGVVWVGTTEGLRSLKGDLLQTPAGLDALSGRSFDLLAPGRDGSIWISRAQKLWQIRAGKIITELATPADFGPVKRMIETTDHRLWISTSSGALACHKASGNWHVIPPEVGLRGPAAALFEDQERNVWCGSFGGGLSRIRARLFQVHELAGRTGVDPYVFNVCSDPSGNVWARFGSSALVRVAAETGVLRLWPHSIYQTIRALATDRKGVLWVGTEGGRLYRLDGDKFTFVLKVGEGVDFISAIFEDSKSNIWVGFTGDAGIGLLPHGDPQQWRVFQDLPFKDVRAIAEAKDGSMWFGTYYGGVSRLHEGRWTQYTTRDGLPSDYVRHLYTDTNGTVWMGTLRGLCCWRDGKFVRITTENGLWNDSISHIAADGLGNFWMSSFGGVFRVPRRELDDFADGKISSIQCVGYNRGDGLPSLECPGGFQPAGTKTPDGRLWFPTEAGLVSIDADHLQENAQPPPVLIEELTVEGTTRPVLSDSTKETVDPGGHRLEFHFTALSLTAPEKVRFRHKLEGLDEDWSQADHQRSATYNYVPPGSYVCRVSACNNDGQWNSAGATMTLMVKPHFWQTLWFKTGSALGFAALMFLLVRKNEQRKSRVRLQQIEQQQALERERARIAKDIHDDAGATLAQIALLSERIQNCQTVSDVEVWNKRIEIAALKTIQSLDEIVWAVSPNHDSLESLANYLSSFAQEHLELAEIRCLLDVSPLLPNLQVNAEVRHNILLTAREALQNAVAHAKATEVCVALEYGGGVLDLSISDNGRGFDPAQLSSRGNGISNMRKRIAQIGGTLEIISAPGMGTSVEFTVPMSSTQPAKPPVA